MYSTWVVDIIIDDTADTNYIDHYNDVTPTTWRLPKCGYFHWGKSCSNFLIRRSWHNRQGVNQLIIKQNIKLHVFMQVAVVVLHNWKGLSIQFFYLVDLVQFQAIPYSIKALLQLFTHVYNMTSILKHSSSEVYSLFNDVRLFSFSPISCAI